MTIPKELIGAVIGPGGKIIQGIQGGGAAQQYRSTKSPKADISKLLLPTRLLSTRLSQ